jgi:hypothetical protein
MKRIFLLKTWKRKKIKTVLAKAQIMTIAAVVLILSPDVEATVFISEVFINPPGTGMDDTREFIELLGTPGKKLDGYAIAAINGTREKLYPLGSIPPVPSPAPEIDEFFSLDGLELGANGILVLLIRERTSAFYYPELLPDCNWIKWAELWNGGLDVPGKLGNDGSFTIMLVRNRPGQTEADPSNPDGLRWGKEIANDAELITPVLDSNGQWKDQWGDGDLDIGQPNGLGGNTLDMVGASTVGDIADDLEIVDEVSFEDGSGWEYDVDARHVDAGSSFGGLPYRHVHALDDPANFTPDALSRVDYRTKGLGWAPAGGGTGEMANGNNWQDTATEQWIRGECILGYIPEFGSNPVFFYVNDANTDPNAVQPFDTHVPLWLADGNVPDYNFADAETYQITAGRINSLAVPFIPGDCDRDGICDANDILKIAAIFGDDDWIFSNGFEDAPEGDSGDPATQTRPWDVDATGDNGIEASDLQWTLNFQGDTIGQIVGIKYDSNTPAATGVYLNPNTGVECTVSTSVNIPSGRTLTTLHPNDIVEVTVSGQVTAGSNTTSGQENGIMQYVHDVELSAAGIMKVTSIEAIASFSKTRALLESLQGTDGDLGVQLINGFTTSFTQGLTGPADLYRITLQAIGEGSVDVDILPALAVRFANSTPHGLKVGHTDSNGDPDSSIYPSLLSITVVSAADLSGDGLVNWKDLDIMCENWLGTDPNLALISSCVGHWKMNDNEPNTTVVDSSGNGNHGTAQQNTSILHTDSGNPPYLNGALTFNGTSDDIAVGTVVGLGAYTKVAWVKRAEGNVYNNIVSSGSTSTAASHALFAPSIYQFKLSAGHSGGYDAVQDVNGLEADTWYHVAVTYDPDVNSGQMVLYKDGVDVVMIFDSALTTDEISHLYNNGDGIETIAVGEVEGDINGDSVVDFLDFGELAQDW